jgi:putative DNA primase/helicase
MQVTPMSDLDSVINQLRDGGLEIERDLVFGKLTHVRVEGGKRSKKQGWYVLYEVRLTNDETIIAGAFGNYKTDFKAKIERDAKHWSDADRAEYKIRMQAARQAQADADVEMRRQCAERARQTWTNLRDSGASPYLQRKKVMAFGVRFARGTVVVPVCVATGALVGLQFIGPDGDKKFLTGTPKKGAFHMLGIYAPAESGSHQILIAEGYATAATVHMATGLPTVMAFDAGNLKPVALALRALYPDARFAFCADDDVGEPGWGCMDCGHFISAKTRTYKPFNVCPHCSSYRCESTNTGRCKATAAARLVGGVTAFPVFANREEEQAAA